MIEKLKFVFPEGQVDVVFSEREKVEGTVSSYFFEGMIRAKGDFNFLIAFRTQSDTLANKKSSSSLEKYFKKEINDGGFDVFLRLNKIFNQTFEYYSHENLLAETKNENLFLKIFLND